MATGPARQLPNSVLPEKYRLSLTPDLQNFTFEGQVDVDVNIETSVTDIVLNAAELYTPPGNSFSGGNHNPGSLNCRR